MPRVLITNNYLHRYAGSEIVTLELAEEFARRGWDVVLYTHVIDHPVQADLEELLATNAVSIYDDTVVIDFDLIWVHHSVLPARVISSLTAPPPGQRLIWHHMSAMPGIESPLLLDVETQIADKVTYIAPEIREHLDRYGLNEVDLRLFPNPAPRRFLEAASRRSGGELRRILVISNHPPAEVLAATAELEARGIEVVSVGGGSPSRVSPETFDGVDAVITIGKTVQYALCMGLPVYVYDHFGGAGWLVEDNFETERETNFSGRATFRKISGSDIALEISGGFSNAAAFVTENLARHQREFSLETHLSDLIREVQKESSREKSISQQQAKRWLAYAELQRENTQALHWERSQRIAQELHSSLLQDQVDLLSEQKSEIQEQLQQTTAENHRLRSSLVGRIKRGLGLLKQSFRGRTRH